MQAWRITSPGEPLDVLSFDDVPVPRPGPGQVAVQVAACGLNFADVLLCRGTYQERPPLPATPGVEVAGQVVAVGDGVDPERIGERVVALPALPHGGLAEVCLADADDAWVVDPSSDLDDVTVAALPITYGTAWVGLFHRGGLRAGETVLVHAAAGGTGSAAVQLAVAGGARVLATAGGAAKVELARSLGAEVVWDSRAEGFDVVAAVREATGGRGVDVVFDPVGGDLFDASRRVVAFEGRYLVIGFAGGRIPEAPMNHVLVKNYSLVGVHWGLYRTERPAVLAEAWAAILASGVRPVVGAVRPLGEAAAALADLAAGTTTGKIVCGGTSAPLGAETPTGSDA